jgi:hypothetical protein
MLADELGEKVVRNRFATWWKDLYLFAEDQDIADRDERTWSFLRVLDISDREERREKKRKVEEGDEPVVVLQDDVALATRAGGRGKVDRLEIPNLLVRGPQRILKLRGALRGVCLTGLVVVMTVRDCPTRFST